MWDCRAWATVRYFIATVALAAAMISAPTATADAGTSPAKAFHHKMVNKGYDDQIIKRLRGPGGKVHRDCWVKFGQTSRIWCRDGYRATS